MDVYFKLKTEVSVLVCRKRRAERFVITSLGGYFPVLAQDTNGTLAVIARDGDIHVGQRGRLGLTLSRDAGESWTHLRPIADEGIDIRNPAFGITSTGTWLLAYISANCYENGFWNPAKSEAITAFFRRSFDHGQTWEEPRPVQIKGLRWISPYGKIVEMPDGTLLMSVYSYDGAYLLRSDDNGKSWTNPSLIAKGYNETTVLAFSSTRLIAVMRRNAKLMEAELWQSESRDGGYTWSKPKQITGPAEHPGDLLLLKSGRVLLTFGHRRPPYGVWAMISQDEGKTWETSSTLVLVADCSTWDVGYPSSIQLQDGRIYIAYYAHDSQGTIKQGERHPIGVYAGGIRYYEDLFFE